MIRRCHVADAGSPLWSAAGQQHSSSVDSLSSPVCPLSLDSSSSAVVAVLPGDAAAASALPGLRLDVARLCPTGSVAGAADVTSLYQPPVDFRSAVSTCFRFAAAKSSSSSSGPDFYRLRRLLRRAKRQAAAVGTGEDAAAGVRDADDEGIGRYPLYCIVCRVRLNAQLQAKQHYHGRSHARRVRLLYGAPAFTAGTASDPAFSSNATSNDAEVSSVYRTICCGPVCLCGTAISFRKWFHETISFITSLDFYCRLETYLFHQSFPP